MAKHKKRCHKSPPVFHETAKWWSCCPQKKAYDWETFQDIPGCVVRGKGKEKKRTRVIQKKLKKQNFLNN
jgi:hypothetical protein